MAGMSSTCNHVAAALFRVEAAMRLGLTNPACTTKACEWLPNRKDVQPVKIKDLNFNRDDFAKRGKKRKKMLSTPKRNYNPLINNNQKTLTFLDIATALEKVTPDSVLSTALLKPKIDFVREVVSMREISSDVTSIDDIILMSHSVEEFFANIKVNFSVTSIEQIQMITKGQNDNTERSLCQKISGLTSINQYT